MEELKTYPQARIVASQLWDIMRQYELHDIEELKQWLVHNNVAPEVVCLLVDGEELAKEVEFYLQQDREAAVQKFRERMRRYRRRRAVVKVCRIAAVIVVLFGCAILYSRWTETKRPLSVAVASDNSLPVIVTAEGKRYNLSDIAIDSLQTVYPFNITYRNNKEIRYAYQTDMVREEEVKFNRLIIPHQCNYQITLCDGSVIHLNAGSSLEYPSRFSARERRVRLAGEAYFEVQHEERPFIVEADEMRIRVYGTKFNVNAYGKGHIETVLAEGKIGISLQNGVGQERILLPNQMSRVDLLTGKQEIQKVDIRKYVSWVTGFLRYDHDPFEKLIEDLSRWYGVEFHFTDKKLKAKRISASISKDASLEEVLAMIETTARVKFHFIERRYMIMQ